MFFASKRCVCNNMLLINDCIIQRVHNAKFLGIHIDDKLSWYVHISELRTKLSKSLGMLRVVSHCMPRNVLKNILYALFYRQLTYGISLWGNTFETYLLPVKILYKKCLRLLCGKTMREQTPPLAKQLNLVAFSDLYFWFLAKFMFKVFHHMLPKCTVSMFTRLSNVVNVNIYQANYYFY